MQDSLVNAEREAANNKNKVATWDLPEEVMEEKEGEEEEDVENDPPIHLE